MTVRFRLALIVLGTLWTLIPGACGVSGGQAAVEMAEPTAMDTVQAQDADTWVAEVCSLIYRGDFAGAGRRLQAVAPHGPHQALQAIVAEHRAIERTRLAGRHKAYLTQIERLEQLRTGEGPTQDPNGPRPSTDANEASAPPDPNTPIDVNDLKGPVDLNDPNGRGIASVLAVAINATEYGYSLQHEELMADPLVRQAIQKATERAARLESEGKWLDAAAYASYLRALDPNNPGYKEYAEGLFEKAAIAASFEDSPCETSQQRYEGVTKQIFTRAVRILNRGYVSAVDYGQMAMEALKRCRQLTEVVATLPAPKTPTGSGASFAAPEPNAVQAWSAGLAALVDQVKQSATGLNEKSFLRLFDDVLQLNGSTVQLPEGVLIWHIAQAALESLDPHTMIAWPRERADFDKQINNEFAGIGVEISKPEGHLTISSLLMDTPAYRAGLDAGDVIEGVDGVPTKDMSLTCAVKKITGPRGTKVALTIRRPGEDKAREITIVRDRIVVPTIYGWQRTEQGQWRYLIDPNSRIAYVRISSFSAETASDLEKVLRTLEDQGLKGLILDLRWNQGGLLPAALRVADMFIREGVILKVKPGLYGGTADSAQAAAEGTHPDYPLVILVNDISASASEIVAGVLADPKHERAVLVGERTHGKGSVQSIEDSALDGAELKYTTAYYYLPSDQRVSSREAMEKLGRKDWGVGPDVEIPLRADEVRAMVEAQRANDVLAQADRATTKEPLQRRTAEQLLAADPQLAIGLLVAKAQIIAAGQGGQ